MLAHEKVGRLLFKLSMPAIIGMMVQGLYNLVDTFFVGRFTGTLGIGGITIAFPIQMIMMGIGMTIGIGGASLISRRMGERNPEGAEATGRSRKRNKKNLVQRNRPANNYTKDRAK